MTNLEKVDKLPLSSKVKKILRLRIPDARKNVECREEESGHDWLIQVFTWDSTPEGHHYWKKIYKKLGGERLH